MNIRSLFALIAILLSSAAPAAEIDIRIGYPGTGPDGPVTGVARRPT